MGIFVWVVKVQDCVINTYKRSYFLTREKEDAGASMSSENELLFHY